jgi:hypothetical protein
MAAQAMGALPPGRSATAMAAASPEAGPRSAAAKRDRMRSSCEGGSNESGGSDGGASTIEKRAATSVMTASLHLRPSDAAMP